MEKSDKDTLRVTATILLEKQFLYLSNQSERKHYLTIAGETSYFENLFEQLSRSVFIDRNLGYVALLPNPGAKSISLKQDETLMLLCLRLIYEEGIENFAATEGAVTVTSDKVIDRYTTETRLEQPNLTRFREIMVLLKRHGIASAKKESEGKNMVITIRPAIRHVVNDDYIVQLEELVGEESDAE